MTSRPLFAFPGWSLDCRMWDAVDVTWCGIPSPTLLEEERIRLINAAPASVTLLGYSLGGYEALKWAFACPDKIKQVVIVGAGPSYTAAQIEQSISWLTRSEKGYLHSFYKACFSKESDFRQFMETMGTQLEAKANLPMLLEQLRYLGQFSFSFDTIQALPFPVTFFHGDKDLILPFSAIQDWSQKSERVVMLDSGHFPFFDHTSLELITTTLI